MDLSRKASYEKINTEPGRSFAFREFKLRRFDSPWHFHPELELTLVLAGTGRRFVGDDIEYFGPGDLVLLGSDLSHYWHSEVLEEGRAEQAHSLVIQFLPDFLGSGFFKVPEMYQVRQLFKRASRGLCFTGESQARVAGIMRGMESRTPQGQLLSLLDILDTLSQSADARMLASAGFAPLLDTRTKERISNSQRYILEHLTESIQLDDVAAHVNMSPSAFSRYFKRVMGKTYSQFVNELRIGQACRALLETDHSIADIAFESGYNNLSNFNRRFRELQGVSPRRFRQDRFG